MAYDAGASSGNLVLLSSQTVSGSSGITYTSLITSEYTDYVLRCVGVTGAGCNNLLSNYSSDNGGSWLGGGNYNGAGYEYGHDGGGFFNQNARDNYVIIQDMTGGNQYALCNYFGINLNLQPFVTIQTGTTNLANGWQYQFVYSSNVIVNAMRIIPDAGTFSGSFKFYGVQK